MRIRSIRPDFHRDAVIAALPREVRFLLVGLWSYVDDNGVGVDDHRQIAADLFPLDDDPVEAREFVRESLARLSEANLLRRYTVEGRSFLFVESWERDQKVDKPNKARYPRPDAVTCGSDTLATPSRESRETPSPGEGEKGRRGEEKDPLPSGGGAGEPAKPSNGASSSRRKPERPLPDTWKPNATHLAKAGELRVDVRAEVDRFRGHAQTHDRRARDWDAAFRMWLTKAAEHRARRPLRAVAGDQPHWSDQAAPYQGD